MKIWIISKYASSLELGFESRIFALARRFVKLGHSTSVLSSDSNHFGNYPKYNHTFNFDTFDGINVLRIKTLKYKTTASLKRILSWLDFELKLLVAPFKKLEKPDVIIVSSLSLLTILNGILLKNKYKAKLIFEIRDIWPLTMVAEAGYNESNLFVKFLGLIEKIGYNNSDLVIGTMPNLKVHVQNVTGKIQLDANASLFGFDKNFYLGSKPNPEPFQKKFNLPTNKFIIGYAGSIGLTNGLEALIECSKILANANDERFLFVLLGNGIKRDVFMKETQEQNNIVFLPKVQRSEVSSFLELCDVLYFASLKSKIWEYGWSPNKLIDYMISGKPVLASYSGYQSMINEANSGIFVPSEDPYAIKMALEKFSEMSSAELTKMGLAGREWLIKHRDWDMVAKEYIDLIRSI